MIFYKIRKIAKPQRTILVIQGKDGGEKWIFTGEKCKKSPPLWAGSYVNFY